MSVLVYAESIDGTFHKPAFEALTYGFDLAKKLGLPLHVVSISNVAISNIDELGKYGATHFITIVEPKLLNFYSGSFATALSAAVNQVNATIVILSASFAGKSIAPRLAARWGASVVNNVSGLPNTEDGFVVKKSIYSGKGFGYFNILAPNKVISIGINSYHVTERQANLTTDVLNVEFSAQDFPLTVTETERQKGKINLTEAERVVSAGRGMKGAENWGMVEELADLLNAATACSKPVSDVGWRPHSEHVGQTGITIAPNLYIAIGISGAIQHLAGVSNSKVIVVINKDKDAPFFKAADYGIVGDAFDVLPKLIEAAKKVKANS
ncbi:MAG: electron transfer flavoprotein subunit alpha/FixB family protein [Bacteroidota bacterium]|nr:electron transfer flavoprotein subunit alpha/FixB family protein [Bacteroidota bacterium]